jgi:hypothetical protein
VTPVRSTEPALPMGKGDRDHVGISSERDTPPPGSARGPGPGSETSWRGPSQSSVTHQLFSWGALSAVLLVCFGLLLGATWTTQALRPKLRRQAEERRRLNAEWSAVRTARRQRGQCPRCASPLSEQDWYFASTLVEDPPDED